VTESPGDISSIEVRRPPRARTFLQARASYSDGAISTDCTVNQLSDAGARLSIASSFALPEIFEIAIPQRGISRRVKLIWRKDDQAEVDFLTGDEAPPPPTASDLSSKIKSLEAENAKLRAQIGVLLQQVHRLTEE
jgi:hypothetical protein